MPPPTRSPASPPPRPTGPRWPPPPAPASPAPSSPPPGSTSSWATCRSPRRPLVAFVGEAPGATEDETGRPFVGRSGALLDQLLGEAGLDRAECAVLNVVKCRPPGNRTPKAPEVARCSGWLHRQLELLDPPAVVALGLSAAKWFLGPAHRARRGAGPSAPHRRPGRLGDLPPVGRHPLRPERGAPRRPAGRPRHRRRGACREPGARAADPGRTPTHSAARSPTCCGPGPRRPRRSAGCGQDGADPGHRRRARRPRSRSPRRRSSSPACTAAAGCRWCTSTPTGSVAWPTSTTSTWTPSTDDSVTVVEWGQGLVERLADEHLEVRLDRRDDDVRTAVAGAARPRLGTTGSTVSRCRCRAPGQRTVHSRAQSSMRHRNVSPAGVGATRSRSRSW